MHWSDEIAENLDPYATIATGVTPSGAIHIGNLRELMIADMVRRRVGSNAPHLLFVDDLDAPNEEGVPLCDIECPCGEHANIALHRMDPFLSSLKQLNIELDDVIYVSEAYQDGLYEDVRNRYLYDLPDVNEILRRCGHSGYTRRQIEDGKLPWRLDWVARWHIWDVDFEPFGKDHATAGGSWETGDALSRHILSNTPPTPCAYEFVTTSDGQALHSSTGHVITPQELIDNLYVPAIRFLYARYDPEKVIQIPDDINEVDKRYAAVAKELDKKGESGQVPDAGVCMELSKVQ